MKLIIGSDHGGKKLKDAIVTHLKNKQIDIEDIGPFDFESVDYPSYAIEVGMRVSEGKADYGILCCGTGIGMSIAANKIHGVRASVVSDCFSAEATKAHNDSNVLCLGERVIGEGLALKIVDVWLATEFEGGERHARRLKKVAELESNY
ncbi:MAG: ribose 5-phosphate isomerase B [Carnobacterium sp.]|uniref:ribose 5-phosphate isomerase B n=1 Tax=Carnobacterium sp. TaxID=48221 RepID=UPI00331519AE